MSKTSSRVHKNDVSGDVIGHKWRHWWRHWAPSHSPPMYVTQWRHWSHAPWRCRLSALSLTFDEYSYMLIVICFYANCCFVLLDFMLRQLCSIHFMYAARGPYYMSVCKLVTYGLLSSVECIGASSFAILWIFDSRSLKTLKILISKYVVLNMFAF